MKKLLLHSLLAALLLALPLSLRAANDDVTVVLDADFTQFTQGSPEAPVDFPSYGTGSFSSFFPSWLTSKIAQAGGALLIKDGGYVRTKSMNMAANGGVMKVTSRVRMIDSYGGICKISCGYSSSNAHQVMLQDSAWHTITVITAGGSSSSNICVEPVLSASGVLVQNLKIEQSPSFVATPTAKQPSQADGTSFTASWSSVPGATAYILNVYSYNGSEKVYKIKDENVGNKLSYKVTGLDPAVTYYYTVTATNGTGFSEPSEEIRVVKVIYFLAVPKNFNAVYDQGIVSCTWDNVVDAQFYRLTANRIYTCPEDMNVDLINEPFDKVTQGSLDAVDFIFRDNLDDFTNTTGWTGEDLALAKGHMAISPFSSTGWLSTPFLNLKGKTGDFTVKANMAAGAFGTFYEGDTAKVALVNVKGDTLQAKEITLSKGFADYNFNFTAGTDSCRVVFIYSGDNKLFINSIVVSQVKAKGQDVVSFYKELTSETNSASFPAASEKNVRLEVRVMAGAETVSIGEITYIYSDPSAPVSFSIGHGGVESTLEETNSFSVEGNRITFTLGAETPVTVSDLTGRILFNSVLPAGSHTVQPDVNGIVIVRMGNKAAKALLR